MVASLCMTEIIKSVHCGVSLLVQLCFSSPGYAISMLLYYVHRLCYLLYLFIGLCYILILVYPHYYYSISPSVILSPQFLFSIHWYTQEVCVKIVIKDKIETKGRLLSLEHVKQHTLHCTHGSG